MDFTVVGTTSRKEVRNVISNRHVITGYNSISDIGPVPYEGPLK